MVKDKTMFIFLPIFLAILYFLYVFYEYYEFDDHGVSNIIQTRMSGIENSKQPIEGLIIGGSNAMWGISARNLSRDSKVNFYNLAMHSNGVNYKNYFQYLRDTLSPAQALDVKYIFWSTIHAIHEPPWNDFDRDILGRLRLSKMTPNQSLLSFVYKQLIKQESIVFDVDQDYGDFIFDNFKCTLSDPRYINESDIKRANAGSYELVNLEILRSQLEIYQNFYKSYFSNAKIIFIIPSTLHEIDFDESQIKDLQDILHSLDMDLYIQNSIPNIKYFCESDHHPNVLGRDLRTKDLTELIK